LVDQAGLSKVEQSGNAHAVKMTLENAAFGAKV
jgi:hypothetical protein